MPLSLSRNRGTATVTTHIELDSEKELSILQGGFDRNLKLIEESLGVSISLRGNRIIIHGKEDHAMRAEKIINELRSLSADGHVLKPDDILMAVRAASSGSETPVRDLFMGNMPLSSKKKFIIPKTEVQKQYIDAIKNNDIVIGIGPAGTGKTYLAMAMAIHAFLGKEVSRIVLARPAIEAGEKLGFLPGDIYEKVNPYLRPLYDALFDMMDADKAGKLIERGIIEIAPLAFMRGRTLNDSFIILDEAQNTTSEQMKMYLTRLGFNSKTVITGDTTQIDLPQGKSSGLMEIEHILRGIDEIKFIYFSERDVVRHKLVKKIVRAYERHEKNTTGADKNQPA